MDSDLGARRRRTTRRTRVVPKAAARVLLLATLELAACSNPNEDVATITHDETGSQAGSDVNAAGGGATDKGDGGAGARGGSGANSAAGGPQAENDCEVIPISGVWAGWAADPWWLSIERSNAGIEGVVCVGGWENNLIEDFEPCTSMDVIEDRGRTLRFRFSGDLSLIGPYSAEASLTLSPERTELLGDTWTSTSGPVSTDMDPVRAVFVPFDEAVPPLDATSCSGGEPSGACFGAPLDVDRAGAMTLSTLSNDDLLFIWQNQRLPQQRLAFARFEAAAGQWQSPRFIADVQTPDFDGVDVSPDGVAAVAGHNGDELFTNHYDPRSNEWSGTWPVPTVPDESVDSAWPVVGAQGKISLVWTSSAKFSRIRVYSSRFDAATEAWQPRAELGEADQAAFAADDDGNGLLVSVRVSTRVATSNELWSSRHAAGGSFDEAVLFHASDNAQIFDPALAMTSSGVGLLAWVENGVVASTYSPNTNSWSEPVLLSDDSTARDLSASWNAAGTARVAYRSNDLGQRIYLSTLDAESGTWTEPMPVEDGSVVDGSTHAIQRRGNGFLFTPLAAGAAQPPELLLGSCDGY